MAFLTDSSPKPQNGSRRHSANAGDGDTDTNDESRQLGDSCYLLVMTPSQRFFWQGPIMHAPIPMLELDLHDLRVRLIADGPNARLAEAKERFMESLAGGDGEDDGPAPVELECIVEQQAHLPSIQRELRRIGVATIRLSEAIVESVSHVRLSLHGVPASQELVENWFAFSSDHGQRVGIYMDPPTWARFSRLLMRLAINWVAFICEDCDPTDHKTFRWTVNALEFAMVMTRGNNILHLDRREFTLLQEKVASCMALLISHFDILGARSSFEAKKEQERLAELRNMAAGLESAHDEDGIFYRSSSPSDQASGEAIRRLAGEWPGEGVADKSVRLSHEARVRLIQALEEGRSHLNYDMHIVGRVVNTDRPEDRSLVALAASSSNISIHWQQGRFIGAGAYGKVYTAHNMDQNTVMAVKEIRFSDVSNLPTVYKEIRDESSVMQMLNHVNIVEYYGIEVHRDKVYIFQEYCDGGSLKDLLEHGRIEQEEVIMNYTCQILEGLQVRPPRPVVCRRRCLSLTLLRVARPISICTRRASSTATSSPTVRPPSRP
jgi:mitogen-activated protein kinase kinase kinase